ncbi:DUF2339 domain-containing protein [Actinophytocola sp.]|uniref:DUF2339 domain-containing protein n=1 Tax=Actinophytocola sp. TaxID=1872138 RepID=UPI002ECFE7E2
MADQLSESLPRLADALVEVGTRLGQIGAELQALTPRQPEAPQPVAAPTESAADPGPPTAQQTPPNPDQATADAAPTPADTADPTAGHPTTEPVPPTSSPADHQAAEAVPPAASHQAAAFTHPADQSPIPSAASQTGHAGPHHGTTGPANPAGAQWPPGPFAARAGGQQREWLLTTPTPQAGPQPFGYRPPTPPPPTPTLWERLSRDGAGSRILAWAGGVVTLAGVVLLLILAIQRGYLGPLPRVLLGAGLGLTLTGIGTWLHRSPTARTGAYALAATGIAVLYLAVVAATSLYGFLTPWGGLLTGLAVTAGGVALAGWWDSQLLAMFVVICCAVSAPIITDGFDALLLGFLLVLLVGTTPVQLVKRWSGLLSAAAAPPVIACLVNVLLAVDHRADAVLTAVLAGVTSGVIVLLATATELRRPGDEVTTILLVLAPMPGMVAALLLPRAGATILPAAIGVLLIVVWALGYVTDLHRPFALTAGGLATLAFLQATATGFDGDARPIAFLAEALVLTVLAVRLRLALALLPAALFAVVGFVLGLVFTARPEYLVQPRFGGTDTGAAISLGLTGALYAAVAITLCWAVFRLEVLADGEHAPHGWVPAGLLGLYGSTATLLSIGLLISPARDGFLLGHVLVTVSWTVAALVLLLRGVDSVPLRVAGLSLVVAALAKLVLFDLSSLDGMARVSAFLVAGLVLLAAGARYAKLVAARGRS